MSTLSASFSSGCEGVVSVSFPTRSAVMAEHMSQSELDYPFKLLEYFNGFRVSKVNISRFIFGKCQSDLMCVDSDFLHYMQELLKYYKLD